MKMLLKILAYVVSYGVSFALAYYAFNNFNGEYTPNSVWVILVIFAIFGFGATRSSSSSFFVGGEHGEGFFLNMLFFAFRLLFSVIAGVFIAPFKIARTLTSLIPD